MAYKRVTAGERTLIQRSIDTRPAVVKTRQSVGHWEGDLINGARQTGNLVLKKQAMSRRESIGL